MRTASLFVRMVRWRVAVTLWFFLLIGAAAQGPLRPGVALLFAAASLSASYVVATTVNDIADRDVDGQPSAGPGAAARDRRGLGAGSLANERDRGSPRARDGGPGRRSGPGRVGRLPRDRLRLLPPADPAVVPNVARTDDPLGRLRDRAVCARAPRRRGADRPRRRPPLRSALLALPRPDQPEGLPRPSRRRRVRQAHAPPRPRQDGHVRGDRHRAGRRVRHTRRRAGRQPGVVAIVSLFAAAILWMLWRLWRTSDPRDEQIAIGLGAKMGNGLLACTLASLSFGPRELPRGCGCSRWPSSRSSTGRCSSR